jgi:hypothetical protein
MVVSVPRWVWSVRVAHSLNNACIIAKVDVVYNHEQALVNRHRRASTREQEAGDRTNVSKAFCQSCMQSGYDHT